MSLESFRDSLAKRRRAALSLFYVSAPASAMAITLVEKGLQSPARSYEPKQLRELGSSILFLLRFLPIQ